MSFDIPEPNYDKILKWIKDVLTRVSFIKGVPIYESDLFITNTTKKPAIAIQRGELEAETDPKYKCIGYDSVKSTLTITLHIPPTEKNSLDPVLYYFEETIFKELNKSYLNGDVPSNLNYFEFNRSKVSNLFDRKTNAIFSNMSQVRFDFGYTI